MPRIALASSNPHKLEEIHATLAACANARRQPSSPASSQTPSADAAPALSSGTPPGQSPTPASSHPIDVVGLSELGIDAPEPEEDGDTFQANALIKSRYYARLTDLPTLADDSGLVVDALDGAPGVISARYAQARGTRTEIDLANNAKLLSELAHVPPLQRTARFVCVMALTPNPIHADQINPSLMDQTSFPDLLQCDARALVVQGSFHGSIILPDQADDPACPHRGRGKQGFGYDPLFLVDPGRYPQFAGLTSAELEPAQKNSISHRGDAVRHLWQVLTFNGG